MSDQYVDVLLPYPDAKVAATLCVGGPCKYEVAAGTNISNKWLLKTVVPHIAVHFMDKIAIVFVKSLLWAIFNEETSKWLPVSEVERVKSAYAWIAGEKQDEDANLIVRKMLVISGYKGDLYIDELGNGDNDAENGNKTAGSRLQTRNVGTERNELLGVYSQLSAVKRECEEIRAQMEHQSTMMLRNF